VDHRDAIFQIHPLFEVAPEPSPVRLTLPVDRMLSAGVLPPMPTLIAPQRPLRVTAAFNKRRELDVADSCLCD
jgi:hypothetical protein